LSGWTKVDESGALVRVCEKVRVGEFEKHLLEVIRA
jgi:hypothetical protein